MHFERYFEISATIADTIALCYVSPAKYLPEPRTLIIDEYRYF